MAKISYEQLFRMGVYRLNRLNPKMSREDCKLRVRMVPPRLLSRFLGKIDHKWKLKVRSKQHARVQLEADGVDRNRDLGDLQRQSLSPPRALQPAQTVDL